MGGEKPYEVELLIAEVNGADRLDMFHIRYDGSIGDEHRYVAIGGEADALNDALGERWRPDLDLEGAVRCAVSSLAAVADRDIPAEDLEVSGLDRTRPRRTFFRLGTEQVAALLED
jgi:proteasome alpha subunit